MSKENVEVVRRLYEAVGRHDAEAVLSAYDPNVEMDFSGGPLASLMGDKVYRGHDGLRKLTRDRYVDFEIVEDDCRELIDAGGERVISHVITNLRGRSSGIDGDFRQYGVWTIRNDKIVRVDWFYSRAEALEAAGLSE
jgi:ketosteroid isomerase-like protein